MRDPDSLFEKPEVLYRGQGNVLDIVQVGWHFCQQSEEAPARSEKRHHLCPEWNAFHNLKIWWSWNLVVCHCHLTLNVLFLCLHRSRININMSAAVPL